MGIPVLPVLPMMTHRSLLPGLLLAPWLVAGGALLGGCTAEVAGTPPNAFHPSDQADGDDDDVPGDDDDDDGLGGDVAPERRTVERVCEVWNRFHQQRETTVSVGADTASCTPGAMTPEGLDDAHERLNLFRWLNGLNPVSLDDDPATLEAQQACALMMVANESLSHGPPASWSCFSDEGDAAAASNLSIAFGSRTAADSVDGFMVDGGANNAQVGHRRHFLNDRLASIGIGAVEGRGLQSGNRWSASCFWVFDREDTNVSGRPFAAYPNPGPSPIDQVRDGFRDEAVRWSVQSPDFSPEGATVSITRVSDGADLPVRPDPGNVGPDGASFRAGGGFGDAIAYVWLPDGWEPQAGETYRVTVDREVSGPLVYETMLVDCAGAP